MKKAFSNPWIWFLALLAVVLGLGILNLNHEISFYDEGIYLANAKSLASGLGYRNLNLPGSLPQVKYPPFFPFLLSLIWRIFPQFPDNLLVMRVFMLLMALGFLTVSYRYLRVVLRIGGFESLAVVGMIGLNPFFSSNATLLTSDIPFALLSVLALSLYESSLARDKVGNFSLMVVIASFAFLTRTVGIFLLAAIFIHLLLHRRIRWSVAFALTSGLVVALWLIWSQSAGTYYAHYPLHVRVNYTGYFTANFSTDSITEYATIIATNFARLLFIWTFFIFPWGNFAIGILIALVVYFFVRNIRQQLRLQDLYCVLYLLPVLIVPYPDTARYFLPLSPFLISYFFMGIKLLLSKVSIKVWSEKSARKAYYIAIAAVVSAALVEDLRVDLRTYREKPQKVFPIYVEFHRMANWIKNYTPPDAILIGDYDPAYYLFTDRKAIHLGGIDNLKSRYVDEARRDFPQAGELLESFRHMKACYLIQDPMIGGAERLYFRNLIHALKKVSPRSLSPLYTGRDGSFVIYKISGCPKESH